MEHADEEEPETRWEEEEIRISSTPWKQTTKNRPAEMGGIHKEQFLTGDDDCDRICALMGTEEEHDSTESDESEEIVEILDTKHFNAENDPHISNNDLLTVMNTRFEEMMKRMEVHKGQLKESFTNSLKKEIKKQVTSLTTEVKTRVAKVMSS